MTPITAPGGPALRPEPDAARPPTVVVGGGITGLTLAFHLHRTGANVLLLEADDSFGGVIRTRRESGWLFESGPNTVLSHPDIDALIEATGLEGERVTASPLAKRRYIVKDGTLHPLPASPAALIRSSLFSRAGKFRLLREPFIPRHAGPEESIADFTRRRLGPEFLEYAVGPFVSGVYAGDPEKLSVRHAVKKIHRLEENHGSLIRGAIALRRTSAAAGPSPRGGILSFRNGLDTLPAALAASLGQRARAGTRVDAVSRGTGGFALDVTGRDGNRSVVAAERVVLAVDAATTARLVAPLDPGDETGASRLAAVPYAAVSVAGFGFRRDQVGHPLDGFGCLVPGRERLGLLGCLFTSSLFEGRAPAGHVALTVYAGGATDPAAADLDDRTLTERLLSALTPLLSISGPPSRTEVRRWRRAIPQYNLGHGDFLDIADRIEARHPGIHLAGNWRDGVSVGDCVAGASALAARLGPGVAAR